MKRTILIAASCAVFTLAGTAWAVADAAAGKAKAAGCAGCHGANGEGKAKFPAIAGMDEYKSGKRENGMMKSAVSKVSDDDMANLAAYYASLKK